MRYLHPKATADNANPVCSTKPISDGVELDYMLRNKSYRRFQINFRDAKDATNFIEAIRHVCPCKANPPTQPALARASTIAPSQVFQNPALSAHVREKMPPPQASSNSPMKTSIRPPMITAMEQSQPTTTNCVAISSLDSYPASSLPAFSDTSSALPVTEGVGILAAPLLASFGSNGLPPAQAMAGTSLASVNSGGLLQITGPGSDIPSRASTDPNELRGYQASRNIVPPVDKIGRAHV